MFNVNGTIKEVFSEQQVNDRFKKREFVLTVNTSQYPQYVLFQLTQDKCSLIDPFQPGEEIKVHFNLRGREWKDREGKIRYFNSLEAWKLEKAGTVSNTPTPSSHSEPVPESFSNKGTDDDLPF
ncbi:MAG: DUF3127 domain-containing protein [Bacteroidia bacterium]|nr:DUF3127 domain-containing protein [Bacteroidia bacterium]